MWTLRLEAGKPRALSALQTIHVPEESPSLLLLRTHATVTEEAKGSMGTEENQRGVESSG